MRDESWRRCCYIDTAAAVVGLGLTQTQSGRALSGIFFLIFTRCVSIICEVGPHLRIVRELKSRIRQLGRLIWLLSFALLLFSGHGRLCRHRRRTYICLAIKHDLRLHRVRAHKLLTSKWNLLQVVFVEDVTILGDGHSLLCLISGSPTAARSFRI